MKTKKSQPEGKQIMPETRLTKFPALSVDPRVGIFGSALETDDYFYSLMKYHSSFLLFMTLYTAFYEHYSVAHK